LRETELEQWLRGAGLSLNDPGGEWITVRECPFCKPTNNKMENMYKLNISRAKGNYNCFRCQAKGSFSHLKNRLSYLRAYGSDIGNEESSAKPGSAAFTNGATATVGAAAPRVTETEQREWTTDLEASQSAVVYLTETRGLTLDTTRKYGVGLARFRFKGAGGGTTEHDCLSFPMYDLEREDGGVPSLVRAKLRAVAEKKHMRLYPTGGAWGLFGLDTVPASATEVVLTEGEFDAMAVHQATGLPAVSLPTGASSLPPAVLPALERFKVVYLWMDNDAAGLANQENFARKLGIGRTRIVGGSVHGIKDANDALIGGHDLDAMVRGSKFLSHDSILTLESIRDDVLQELRDPMAKCGIQYSSLPTLNTILKGHRRGEFTVLTGATGVGKTTLLAQLSLDLATQGVRTLWGSFEIPSRRLAGQLFTMYLGGSDRAAQLLSTSMESESLVTESVEAGENAVAPAVAEHQAVSSVEAELWADFVREVPLSMLAFHGSTSLTEVLDTMRHACYTDDVTHIILDNLQFMLSGQGAGIERYELQERAIAGLRAFATEHSCHVTLVVHPRKEDDDAPLSTASIFGAAKVREQVASMTIERDHERISDSESVDNTRSRQRGHLTECFQGQSKVCTSPLAIRARWNSGASLANHTVTSAVTIDCPDTGQVS
jgi:twinkle protein